MAPAPEPASLHRNWRADSTEPKQDAVEETSQAQPQEEAGRGGKVSAIGIRTHTDFMVQGVYRGRPGAAECANSVPGRRRGPPRPPARAGATQTGRKKRPDRSILRGATTPDERVVPPLGKEPRWHRSLAAQS